MVWLWRKRRGVEGDGVWAYGNRLDQIREDDRVERLVESEALRLALEYFRIEKEYEVRLRENGFPPDGVVFRRVMV